MATLAATGSISWSNRSCDSRFRLLPLEMTWSPRRVGDQRSRHRPPCAGSRDRGRSARPALLSKSGSASGSNEEVPAGTTVLSSRRPPSAAAWPRTVEYQNGRAPGGEREHDPEVAAEGTTFFHGRVARCADRLDGRAAEFRPVIDQHATSYSVERLVSHWLNRPCDRSAAADWVDSVSLHRKVRSCHDAARPSR